MAGAARWLAALMLCAWRGGLGDDISWPGCPEQYRVVEPGRLDNNATKLRLSDCSITAITSNQLKGYPNLLEIDVTHNRISHIEAGAFDFVASLQFLYLRYNRFLGRNLPSSVFRRCRHLYLLDFSGNFMSDAPAELLRGLDELNVLQLNNCSLSSMPAYVTRPVLRSLEYLFLNNNHITKLDPETFMKTLNLSTLHLKRNQIEYLHKDLFKPLTRLENVYLKYNKLRFIPEELFQNKSFLTMIDLSYNLIEFVSVKAFFGTNLQELLLNNNRLTYLTCDFCTVLKSIGVSLNNFSFYNNPWQCGCLNELLVEVKTLPIYNFANNYDGRHPACFLADGFKCHRIDDYIETFIPSIPIPELGALDYS